MSVKKYNKSLQYFFEYYNIKSMVDLNKFLFNLNKKGLKIK